MRLIDADALDKLLNDCMERYKFIAEPIGIIRSDEINAIRNLIKEQMPTVDAVPVVRCKDCRYRNTDPHCKDVLNDNWYCADGERRESE